MTKALGLATLIVNPAAGRASLWKLHAHEIEVEFISRGYTVKAVHTTDLPDSARDHARRAAKDSALVFACGGDGTIHGVIQGLANTSVPLGIVPLGTANALARNLRIPLHPLRAIRRLLSYQPTIFPLGVIHSGSQSRFFTVMAGCGPDGALVHALNGQAAARFKRRFGRGAYYLEAARLFATRAWPAFEVSYCRPGSSTWETISAVALIAARVRNLGGAFAGLTSDARLEDPYLRLHILLAPAHLSLLAWFTLTRVRLGNPLLRTIDVEEVRCTPKTGGSCFAQADAELIGCIPISMTIAPRALCLLAPAHA